MLYRVNDFQWVSLKNIEVVMLKQGVNGNWYIELYTGNSSYFTDDFDSKDRARLEVLKINKIMEDLVV